MAVDYANALVESFCNEDKTLMELVKEMLGICHNDTSQDPMLCLYIEMACSAAELYIDNKIVRQSVTERIAHPYNPVPLRYWPAGEPTAAASDGDDVLDMYSTFVQDGITWVTTSTCGKDKSCCFKQLDITYDAGYDPIPANAAYALAATAVGYSKNAGNVSGAVSKEVVNGVGSITYDTGGDSESNVGVMTPTSIAVLELYRRYHV